jgi:hypothetical protein
MDRAWTAQRTAVRIIVRALPGKAGDLGLNRLQQVVWNSGLRLDLEGKEESMAKNHRMLPWRLIRETLVVAAIFAIPAFGGLLIGCALDQWQNTEPVFTLILLGLGVTGGFYGLISTLRRMNERKHNQGARP